MRLFLSCFLLITYSCFGQESDKRGTIKIEKTTCIKLDGNDSVYIVVDRMPEFPGGIDSLSKWVNINLRYPKIASEENRSGTVFASFIIQNDGAITDIKVLKGMDPNFEKEAVRLIKLMPKWHPGSCNGTYAPVKVNFPVKFMLR